MSVKSKDYKNIIKFKFIIKHLKPTAQNHLANLAELEHQTFKAELEYTAWLPNVETYWLMYLDLVGTKNFGDLEAYPEKDKTKGKIEIFNVSNVSEDGKHLSPDDQRVILQKNNSRWHTDSSYRYYPSIFSILYGHTRRTDE